MDKIYQDKVFSSNLSCSCGGKQLIDFNNAVAQHYVHNLGEQGCYKKVATGNLIPINFRVNENESVICDVNGHTITEFTLLQQRDYFYHEKENVWSLLKDEESITSLEND